MPVTLESLSSVHGRVAGVKQVAKAVQRGLVDTVFVAEDANRAVLQGLLSSCSEKGIEVVWVSTMAELGRAAGIQVGSAAVAVPKA